MLALLLLAGSSLWCRAASITLAWDPSVGAQGYKLYQKTNLAFVMVANVPAPTVSATVTVDTNITTVYYVTAWTNNPSFGVLESPASNLVTNNPSAPTTAPIMVVEKPVMGTTNLTAGGSVGISARLRNDGTAPFSIQAGSITILAPGATRADGPYIQALAIPAQTVGANQISSFQTTWTAPSAIAGTWLCYLVVQTMDGSWIAGPFQPFTVSAQPPPPALPPAPTNLRVAQIGTRSADLQWLADLNAATQLERAVNFGAFSALATVTPGVLHYADAGLQKRKTYSYRARSVNQNGTSPPSNHVIFSTH